MHALMSLVWKNTLFFINYICNLRRQCFGPYPLLPSYILISTLLLGTIIMYLKMYIKKLCYNKPNLFMKILNQAGAKISINCITRTNNVKLGNGNRPKIIIVEIAEVRFRILLSAYINHV